MSNICIIPARGGSKRIPKKNIKDFLGRPIISYAIESALRSNLFDEVMVSTDDQEIAQVALYYGAKVPFLRTTKNADDFSTTTDVLIEVLNEYMKKGNYFSYACCLYPTTPLLNVKKLEDAYKIIMENKFETVLTVQSFSFPIQRAFYKNDELVTWVEPKHALLRSQDLPKTYHDSGQFYFFKVSAFLESKILINTKTAAIEINELEAQDIDNESDWKIAEIKYKALYGEQKL
jgi:pseudaminic acid cytidylyltransferase